MSRNMKESGIKWIGKIPEEWWRTKLKRVLEIPITDGPHETPELVDDGIPFISAEAIKNNKINFNLKRGYISFEDHKRFLKKCSPFKNDIFMIKSGATTGNLAIVETDIEFSIWSPLALIRAKASIMYFRYLFFYMQSYIFRQQIEQFWNYGTQQNIGMEVLGNLYLAYPEIYEQKKISNYLDNKCSKIDETIEKQKIIIEKLKAYKQSVITEVVTKGLDQNVPKKDSGIVWIGEIPAHWQIKKIKYLLLEINDRSEDGIEEPLSMSQVFGIIKSSDLDIPNPTTSYIGNKKVYANDLVFNKLKAHLGVFAVSKYDGIVSPDYSVYRGLNMTETKFMEYLFKTPQYICEFKKYIKGVGAGLSRLYTTELFNIKVSIPPLNEQKDIVNFINTKCLKIDNVIAQKEKIIEKLTEYRKSLIYECVTGEREVQ